MRDADRIALTSVERIAAGPADQAFAMPAELYRSPDILELELNTIFMRDWICLGRADALAEPGSYTTWSIGDQPIVAVRQRDGTVKSFANVCLHRMMVLLEGEGHCKRIVCPYHAWTYDLDGSLIGAPEMNKRKGFDKGAYQLPELRTEVWEGWLYVNMDPEALPVAQCLGPLGEITRHYGQEHYIKILQEDHVWQTNWKLLTENFMEGYHLPVAHKASVGAWMPLDSTTFPEQSNPHFTYQTFVKGNGASYGVAHKDNTRLTGDWRQRSILPTVFPSHMYVLAPDHLWYLSLSPKGTGEVRVRFGASVAPEVLAATEDRYTLMAEMSGFFDQVNAEDKVVVEGIYKGAKAPLSTAGPLSWLEYEIHDFIKYLARKLVVADAEKPMAAE